MHTLSYAYLMLKPALYDTKQDCYAIPIGDIVHRNECYFSNIFSIQGLILCNKSTFSKA